MGRHVAVGDVLWLAETDGSKAPVLKPTKAVEIERTIERGMHAPLTADGSVIVNGLLASSYAGAETLRWGNLTLVSGHDVVKFIHAPLRWWCELSPSTCAQSWHSAELG